MVFYVKNKKTKHKRNKIYGNIVTKKKNKIQITLSLNIDQTYVLHQHIHRITYIF